MNKSMELQEFIKHTLLEIFDGVYKAQDEIHESGKGTVVHTVQNSMQDVEFDVAITTSETTDGGVKVNVMGTGLGVGGARTHEAVSRVKFKVPISYSRKPASSGRAEITSS